MAWDQWDQVLKMKAVNRDYKGDDAYYDRLFSYLKTKFLTDNLQLKPIRKDVFLLKSQKMTCILKGYRSDHKLKVHDAFTSTLRKEGFFHTYKFLNPPGGELLTFEGTYFACIEYISPNEIAFTYQTFQNRKEALKLLEEFHQITSNFEARYRTLLPKAELLGKWIERYKIFINNLPTICFFIKEPYISEIISWASWSLSHLEKNQNLLEQQAKVILHGDVAHHNFLRDESGRLFLIDFDLIQIGPPAYDYLQMANRFLPHLNWSFERLSKYKQIRKYIMNRAFLYALAYPADIFREWNRIIREKTYSDPNKLKYVIELSIGQFNIRKQFIEQLKNI
jgi:thiamine kinase-like enzyme